MQEPSTSFDPTADLDPINDLPLQMIKSGTIPPAPNRSEYSIDWLPDFAGYSWIAYGASSLLVISHFPSPLSHLQSQIGPVLRQVFELSDCRDEPSSAVDSVAWSPVTPSCGDLAAASDNSVFVFEYDSKLNGSFCWSQTAVLVQSIEVLAIRWTGSGDGIVVGGTEVVLWRNKFRSWEIAWKFIPEHPQTLVSANWSIEEPVATSAYQSEHHFAGSPAILHEASKSVLVCHDDGKSEHFISNLHHPWPVFMIQWRPVMGRQQKKYPVRNMLLTCCLDGTVRLWSEIDGGRIRKPRKDTNNQKTMRRAYCVVGVIEINQSLNATLGIDIFVAWATQIGGGIDTGDINTYIYSMNGYECDKAGRCEWLVGVGPGKLLIFWAIHCLDDVSPPRFPRITQWERRELKDPEIKGDQRSNYSRSVTRPILDKVVILRNCSFGPPALCSLVQLLPCNSLCWSVLYTQTSICKDGGLSNNSQRTDLLSCYAGRVLNIDGHNGKILQVEVHPSSEAELAASLDSNGLVLFWSLATFSNCIMHASMLNSIWRPCGRLVSEISNNKYLCLSWAPSILYDDRVLLLGHAGGIDCFVVNFSQREEGKLACHLLCTIPFIGHGSPQDGPTDIFSFPLSSTRDKPFSCNNFLLLGVWMKDFKAISWKIAVHSYDLPRSCCECSFDATSTLCGTWRFEITFLDKKYCVFVDPCSLELPDLQASNQVTSLAVVSPGKFVPSVPELLVDNDSIFHMATGCTDGRLKLWRSNLANISASHVPWELIGMFAAHHGPINAVSFTDCGRKFATTCMDNGSTNLHLWDSLSLTVFGTSILEAKLSLGGEIVALNWFDIGTEFILGVCMRNELRVYASRRCGSHSLANPVASVEDAWSCIATVQSLPPVCDFLWGSRSTAIIIHGNYFSLFGQWLSCNDITGQTEWHLKCMGDNPDCFNESEKENMSSIFSDISIFGLKEILTEDSGRLYKSRLPLTATYQNNHQYGNLITARTSGDKLRIWSMLDIVEKLCGSLPVYYPEALLENILSGNWKRAFVAVRHLVGHLTSYDASEQKGGLSICGHIVPQVNLSDYLEGLLSKSTDGKGLQWSREPIFAILSSQIQEGMTKSAYGLDLNVSNDTLTSVSTKNELGSFVESVERLHHLASLSSEEKLHILAIIDLLHEISFPNSASAYESLDAPGRRFWVAVKFQKLFFNRRFGGMAHTHELVVPSKLIAWALQSDCHEVLLGSVLSDEPSWQEMRKMGIGFWFTSSTQLRNRMEKLARLQYLKSRDPKACALLYIALNRLQVLAGLFKISKDEKDKPLVGFLSRNFREEKNKAAALKNAYVLMGRHQLELAIAFFLLGGDTSSAVTVCAKNLGDEQLALVICQLIEGPGGPLERNLISKFLFPSAVEKGDHWLASLLEWKLGNYSQAFLVMLGSEKNSPINPSARLQSRSSFMDPSVGQYCQLLVTRNGMKNAIGEKNAAFLGRWATLMTALAFNRCGLPLEALESLSSSLGAFGSSSEDSLADAKTSEALDSILGPLKDDIHKWVSRDVAFHLESHTKFDMAMRHISRLLREHPSCPNLNVQFGMANACSDEPYQYKTLIDNFQNRLFTALASFEQRFSLISISLINKIFVSLCNRGLSYVGYDILHRFASRVDSADTSYSNCFPLHPCLPKLLLKATEETSCLFSRYVVLCSLFNPLRDLYSVDGNVSGGSRPGHAYLSFIQDLMQLMWSLRAALRLICCPSIEDGIQKCFTTIDLFEYFIHIASAWLQRSYDYLIMMVEPLFTPGDGQISYKIDMKNLRELVQKASDLLPPDMVINEVGSEGGDLCSIPENARWKILGACLWRHLFKFMEQQLHSIYGNLKEGHVPVSSEPGSNSIVEQGLAFSLILTKSLETTLAHVSHYHAKQLASLLRQKAVGGLQDKTLLWLRDFTQPHLGALHRHLNHEIFRLDTMNSKTPVSLCKRLWDIFVNPKIINEVFSQENISWSEFTNLMPLKGWIDEYSSIMGESKADDIEGGRDRTSASTRDQSPTQDLFSNNEVTLGFRVKDTTLSTRVAPFQNPKEVYKKNGELLEALCINSTDQCQAALATNKKGIVFFHWVNESPVRDQSELIWSDAEWPKKGWAASESTPVPTCISPGVGLWKKRGVHLGLGGATVGAGPLARPGRDLTGGGAFGIPGYAGIGSSGLGWEIQEDFEELIDKPATLENINTRTFSSHPSRPFFLVGSSNTHIYLWEFGKDKATATYGVLPAANVPPPYALASISAVQFDQFGQRFATAALDGTVSTWQLEVGGRNNIFPTESSLCFNNHAVDVTYVTSSGSIIAAAGYNSDNVNVVIWDMLAPPTASRASVLCHEGGACSISVLKDDVGNGSISPLIVTGGKGGDVAVHDFRYIATGKSKQQRRLNNGETNGTSLTADMQGGMFGKKGDQSQNGILWYIPKAHSASVTRIASIPNTSLFLTGSKDGDIKLWDVQKSRILFHWPKLHERHTFIQPTTRGFGGVVRAGVTDIQVIFQGFLSCGGDGSVKLIKLGDLS